jgi:hypothetical protein
MAPVSEGAPSTGAWDKAVVPDCLSHGGFRQEGHYSLAGSKIG